MKTIGKIAALAMTVGMALALTACGGSASSSAASSSSASASASSSSASTTSSSASASASASTASASSSAASSASSASADYYENEYFAVSYTLPEGWKFAEDANLSELNSQIAAAASGARIDMAARSADETGLVVFAIEEANAENAGQTPETHLEAEVKQLTDSATSGNVTATTESADLTFEGSDSNIPFMITALNSNGTEYHIGQACMQKDGDFFDILVMGTTEADITNTISGLKLILG